MRVNIRPWLAIHISVYKRQMEKLRERAHTHKWNKQKNVERKHISFGNFALWRSCHRILCVFWLGATHFCSCCFLVSPTFLNQFRFIITIHLFISFIYIYSLQQWRQCMWVCNASRAKEALGDNCYMTTISLPKNGIFLATVPNHRRSSIGIYNFEAFKAHFLSHSSAGFFNCCCFLRNVPLYMPMLLCCGYFEFELVVLLACSLVSLYQEPWFRVILKLRWVLKKT